MATITERFGFTKPAGSDPASIVPLNSNTDLVELYLGRTQDMIAPMYDDTATYEVDDIVTYESKLYKCITAISIAETFDPTKWEETTAVQEGSGGGGGGTEVIANPTGTPTDTLNTIDIDGVIYDIEGSGGGDGGIKTVRTPINNTDSSESINVNVGSSFTSETVDITHFVKDLAGYQFSGSSSYTSNTVFNSYNNGILNISWDIQSGTSRQFFNIGYIDDLADLVVLSDWTRYDTDGTYEFVIPSEAQDLTVEDFYIDFRNVKTGGATLALSSVIKTIENGKLKVTFPFPSGQTVYMECRILYALTGGGIQPVGVHASDIEYDNTTSQLTATNVQDALDEVVGRVSDAEGDITELNSSMVYEKVYIENGNDKSYIEREGRKVFINFGSSKINVLLGYTLPAQFRPSDTIRLKVMIANANTYKFTLGRVLINPDGHMKFFIISNYGGQPTEITGGQDLGVFDCVSYFK